MLHRQHGSARPIWPWAEPVGQGLGLNHGLLLFIFYPMVEMLGLASVVS
jgi:hypothetical protein